jgi:copper chaperone NosL
MLAALTGCGGAPRELVAGLDACEYCRMTISDTRFGGQVISATGKVHTFDAIECLASYVLEANDQRGMPRIRVADFESARLILVDSAVFLESSSIASPMGRSLVAFAAADSSDLVARYGGRRTTWSGVLDLMRAERIAPGAGGPDTLAAGRGRHLHGDGR